jgi:hypothetical protein
MCSAVPDAPFIGPMARGASDSSASSHGPPPRRGVRQGTLEGRRWAIRVTRNGMVRGLYNARRTTQASSGHNRRATPAGAGALKSRQPRRTVPPAPSPNSLVTSVPCPSHGCRGTHNHGRPGAGMGITPSPESLLDARPRPCADRHRKPDRAKPAPSGPPWAAPGAIGAGARIMLT